MKLVSAVERNGMFQYRKRYEITCDDDAVTVGTPHHGFQYRKRYEITCDEVVEILHHQP